MRAPRDITRCLYEQSALPFVGKELLMPIVIVVLAAVCLVYVWWMWQ
jgi:hypothetical protein